MTDSTNTQLATPAQIRYIHTLIDERNLLASDKHYATAGGLDKDEYADHLQTLKDQAASLPKKTASNWIIALLTIPRKSEVQQTFLPAALSIPAGRYALLNQGEAIFLQVDIGTSGKWDGYVFLSELQGDRHRPIKDRAERTRLLEQIAADIEGATRAYGQFCNECGCCGLSLTDPFSRYYGVGPVCRKNRGMPISRAAFLKARPEKLSELLAWEAENAA